MTPRRLARLLCVLLLPLGGLFAQQPQQAVLVTGASSGIGRKIAETLAREGYFVYAGARKAEDLAELSRVPGMKGIRLDVTSSADISAAVETVRKDGRGLYGLVNNAGIAVVGALIDHDEREMQSVIDVNVYGPWRVTKAFAPMLIASKGRVVTTSSISGVLSGPFLGAYSMSKHAIEAFSDAFGAEMAGLGVKSSLVEPGNYRSDIGRNTMAQVDAALERAKGTPFEGPMRNMKTAMGNYDNYPEPDEVAKATLHAIRSPTPQARYMVVPAARQAEVTIRKAIEEMVQLNQNHAFTYDREALVKMLDEALARIK